MQFSTSTILSILAFTTSTLAAPARPSPPSCTSPATPSTSSTPSGDYIYRIDDLFIRKPDGKNINSIGFNIAATNGGTLDFACRPYDPATGATSQTFEDKKVYFCGKNSSFSFSFTTATNELFLWQTVSDTINYGGNSVLPNYCRAGGNGPNDFVCQGTSDVYLSMKKLGA